MLRIKINMLPSRVNGKTVQGKEDIGVEKKIPDKSRKGELSPQLSLEQEVSPKEAALLGPDHRGRAGSHTKRQEVSSLLQEVTFCSFGSTKSGPRREGGGKEPV